MRRYIQYALLFIMLFAVMAAEGAAVYQKPSKQVIKQQLTTMQYYVTQLNGTEFPYRNQYWNHKKKGIYVDIVSGEPLFSSTQQYDSKTGWPSFTAPLVSDNIIKKADDGLFFKRTELRSKVADSHLGHLFKDGPPPAYQRYCINSAALEFIPYKDLMKRGYGQYLYLFK